MNYKQKYEEALEKARQIHNANRVTGIEIVTCENIFPELRESEDERIRKEIIQSIKDNMCVIHKEKCLAWLEKQGKQNNNEDVDILQRFSFYSYKDEPNVLYLSGLYVNEECRNKGIGTKILEVADEAAKSLNCHTIRLKAESGSDAERLYKENGYNTLKKEGNQVWLEKRCEQPSWSEEDEKIINTIISDITRIRTSCGIGTEEYNIRLEALNWLKSFKPQQKQEWDNKDDGMLNCLITTLCEEEHGGIETNKRFVNWLKSIKDRVQPQPKQEWSEKDEKKT